MRKKAPDYNVIQEISVLLKEIIQFMPEALIRMFFELSNKIKIPRIIFIVGLLKGIKRGFIVTIQVKIIDFSVSVVEIA